MTVCDHCGRHIERIKKTKRMFVRRDPEGSSRVAESIEYDLPFTCNYCGGNFCSDHRLPENHSCPYDFVKAKCIRQISSPTTSYEADSILRAVRNMDSHLPVVTNWRKLLGKILLVGLLICMGTVVVWKAGALPEEINQRFEVVVGYLSDVVNTIMDIPVTKILDSISIYLQGLWISITEIVSTEDPPVPLNPFVSVDDIIRFLDNDNVSDVVYASDFKCGDFAEALVGRAYNAGYDMEVYSMFGSELDDFTQYVESLEYVKVEDGVTTTTSFIYGLGAGHAICKTKIGSVVYLVEPQDDMVIEIIEDGYDIVYFGEVTK